MGPEFSIDYWSSLFFRANPMTACGGFKNVADLSELGFL